MLSLHNTQLTEESALSLLEMLEENDKLILLDIEKNPRITHDTARAIQECINRNRDLFQLERRREWLERKELTAEEENVVNLSRARESEISMVKEIMRKAQDVQFKREQVYVETQKKQEEDRKRLEKKMEKEALIRAKTKKKKKGKKK